MRQKAFTLSEAVVVLVLTALLALVVVPRLSTPAKAGASLEAKTALESVLSLAANTINTEGSLTDLTTTSGIEKFSRSLPRFTILPSNQASQAPSEISVYSQGNKIIAAVTDGIDCYWVKRDFEKVSDYNFYAISVVNYNGNCNAEKVLNVQRTQNLLGDELGKNWKKPMEIQ